MMIDELKLSPMGYVIFFVVAIGLLVVALRRKSYFTLDCELLDPKEDKAPDTTIQARYGAVMQIERH